MANKHQQSVTIVRALPVATFIASHGLSVSLLLSLWLELLYFTGCVRLAELFGRSRGAILRFQRVRPPRSDRFQPLRSAEITPAFLDRLLRRLRRWRYDIVSIDQLHERLQDARSLRRRRRFVCLTFDIGYKDFLEHAWPIVRGYDVPVTLYIPTNFPDRVGELWWLALEQVVLRHDRIGFTADGIDHRIGCRSTAEKTEAFDFVYDTLRAMAPAECSTTIRDLCRRYGVDLDDVSSAAAMSWQEIATIAADPLATIGSATVSYPVLSRLDRQSSERELRMGQAVVEAALGRRAPHLAYPHGDRDALGRREILLAGDLGFATAVTTEPGVIGAAEAANLLSLPRISWDGRRSSLRVLRAAIAGLGLKRVSRQR
jgi:peptidoglycan/xylan/chitin deacetylase (PgdA/CDA1 family)